MNKINAVIKKLFGNDYFFSVFAKVFGVGIGLVLSVVSSRFFGAELKGVDAVIMSYVSIYSVFLGMGIYQAYPFYRKREPDIMPQYLNNISTMFLGYEFIGIVIACVLLKLGTADYLAIAMIVMPVEVYIKQLNYIVLIEYPRRRNIASIIISTTEIIVIALFWLFSSASFMTVVVNIFIVEFLNLFISFYNLKVNPLKIRLDGSRLWEFAKFGFIPMLVYLCMTINYRVDIQMLKWFDNVTYSDIGVYSLGIGLAQKIWMIPDAVKDILLSKLIKGKGENEVAKVLRINITISVLATFILIAVGQPVINWIYGYEYKNAYFIMVLMLVGVIGMIFYKMIYSYNISKGKRIINLIFLAAAAVLNIIGNCFLIPILNIYGAAIVSVASYNICGVCFLVYFRKVSGISYRNLLWIKKEDVEIVKGLFAKK